MSLVVDARDLVAEFAGASTAALRLRATSRAWHEAVSRSDVWRPRLADVAPLLCVDLLAARGSSRRHGDFSADVDWLAAIARARRRPMRALGVAPKERVNGADTAAPSPSVFARIRQAIAEAVLAAFSRLPSLQQQRKQAPHRVLVFGSDGAGKSALMRHLCSVGDKLPVPTIGFAVEDASYRGFMVRCWAGASASGRAFRMQAPSLDAFIFVADSAALSQSQSRDAERVDLRTLLAEIHLHVPVLILANKQDLPWRRTPQRVAADLRLPACTTRRWAVFGTCATTGDGVAAAFEWLQGTLDLQRQLRRERRRVERTDTTPWVSLD